MRAGGLATGLEKVGPRRSGCGVRTTFMHRFLAGPREEAKEGGRYIPRNKERKRRGRMGSPVTDARIGEPTSTTRCMLYVRVCQTNSDYLAQTSAAVARRRGAPSEFSPEAPDRILDGRR